MREVHLVYKGHRFDSVGVVSIRIAIFFMASHEGLVGDGSQDLPEERADAPLTHTRKGVEKKAVASAKVLALPLLPLAQAQAQALWR